MTNENWMEGIDQAAVDKAVSAGEILPKLPLPAIEQGATSSKETLEVTFLENPKKVSSPKFQNGFVWLATVEHQGARKSMFVPETLRFGLVRECKLHKLADPVGHTFLIGAIIKDLPAKDNKPARKQAKLYWCQFKVNATAEDLDMTADGEASA